MIAKVIRGTRVQGLIRYLYGPGRFNEHRDPHIVAGFDDPARLELPVRDGRRDYRRLDGLMRQTLAVLGDRNHDRPIWHVPVRAHPDDPILTDAQWAEIAAEIMHRTGLAPRDDPEGVRWFAIRHADDHIHIVATLARQDGQRPNIWGDRYRVREACRAVEDRHDLHRTPPADGTAATRPTRAETEKARRTTHPEPPRVTLRRHVQTAAASAQDEKHFLQLLQTADVALRLRHSPHDPTKITGYAVALHTDPATTEHPIWFSGSTLAPDLSLPRLRTRWPAPQGTEAEPNRPTGRAKLPARLVLPLTDHERQAIYTEAARAAEFATAYLRQPAPDLDDAFHATLDILRTAAATTGNPHLHKAADTYDRAARPPHRRIPTPTPAGQALRTAARTLAATHPGKRHTQTLITALITLLEAITTHHRHHKNQTRATATQQTTNHLARAAMPKLAAPNRIPEPNERPPFASSAQSRPYKKRSYTTEPHDPRKPHTA
ncbi:relaxase/mobilization nuclease domain-containing protein [Actinomadura atramentaria]|uniref:relaxase/mobilization nuclease domain-containing protein n=1 Tax=Actinomadura atramentaria TaxID=1990 RepID=UPI00039DFDBD|nr:relaxase/mobilization nuclease domain-containing protein [Actinomadura atramentaria]